MRALGDCPLGLGATLRARPRTKYLRGALTRRVPPDSRQALRGLVRACAQLRRTPRLLAPQQVVSRASLTGFPGPAGVQLVPERRHGMWPAERTGFSMPCGRT